MFDLNLDVISSASSSSCPWRPPTYGLLKLPEEAVEDSGTSNSSIVNVEEANAAEDDEDEDDEDSSSLLTLDFMTKREEEEEAVGEIVTRQFFPVVSGGVGEGEDYRGGFGKGPQWLYLSFGESGGEFGILQQKQKQQQMPPPHQPMRKSRRGPRSRSSQYRGVTFYRRTGRWESHIWDCGKQVYLGGFDTAYAAARAYDRAAIKFRGVDADINFSVSDYQEDMKQMPNLTKEEFVHILRRQSSGFSRKASKYRGMILQKCGQWDPRMGQFLGKNLYDKAVRKLEPDLNKGQIMFNGDGKESSGQNLDLSLSMSPTPIFSKVVKNEREYSQWIDPTFRLEFPMAGCSSSVPKGGGITNFALPPKRPPMWSTMYPAVPPNYEVMVSEKRVEAISSSSSSILPSYRWQSHGSIATISTPAPYAVPMFGSNNHKSAASSGFSSPTTMPPPPYLATVSASSSLMNKNGFRVPAAGGYYTYRG